MKLSRRSASSSAGGVTTSGLGDSMSTAGNAMDVGGSVPGLSERRGGLGELVPMLTCSCSVPALSASSSAYAGDCQPG